MVGGHNQIETLVLELVVMLSDFTWKSLMEPLDFNFMAMEATTDF